MKKLLLGAALVFGIITAATAQNKIGYVNFGEVMQAMPEVEKAQKAITAYQNEQADMYKELTIELNALDSTYNADSAKWTENKKEFKRKDINDKYIGLQKFEQEAKEKIQAKQEEIVNPIRDKAAKMITEVAKENGYSYVFNDDGNNLIVKPQGDNLISLVKAKLGVKAPAPVKPATKPAGGARK
jgi:outer membrane protein